MQAREELTVLTKRMRELAREKALLQLGTTSSPSDGSLSTAKPPNVLPARPSSSDGAVATITLNPQRPKNITSAPPPSHRPPSLLQQAPSKKPTAPLHLKAASTAPAAVDAKHLTTPRNLSRLDDFLAQAKTLPMIPVADHPHANGALLSPWKTSKGIKKLLAAESCIFELDHLCLPSELIRYVIPDRLTEVQIGLSHPQSQPGNKASHSNRDVLEYESPLSMFRSFRFSPRYLESVRDGYRSLTYSNKIDPLQSMCLYELSGGSCNDDSCKSQHLRDCTMTDEELIIDMARYSEGNTPEARQVFAQMQSAKLAHLRASGIHNVDILIDSIAKNHRDFLHDPSRVVKFGERITIGSELLGKSNGMKKRKGVTRYRAVDRIVSNMDANADTSPLDQSPIVMAILAKTLSGSPSKMKRYHEHRSSVDYEKLLEIDTSDETLWIEYAISHLLDTSEDEGELNIHNALSVLARALGVNPTSESLWSLYLDLYTRNGTEVETRQMFEQCLQYVPDAQLLWFRYYLWEKSRNERVYVLDRMLEKACQEPREGDDKAARSRFTLDVVLQIIKTMVSENCVESAKNWLQNFLICSSWEFVVPSTLSYAQLDDVWREQDMVENISATLAAKLLTPIDLCIMWLAFVYLVWFHELPEQLFLDYPNNYIADSRLFTIQWPETEEPEQENELHNIVHEIFLGLTFYFVDCEARPSLIATLKNFVGFLQARGQKQEEILELVNPSQFPESLPEIQDLFCQVRMHFDQNEAAKRDLQQAIQDSPNQPYLWNRYARLLPDEGKAACLEQCALEFFTVEPRHEAGMGRTELALLLYRKLLGLELPYSYTAPPTRLEIAPFKTNVFLWLNYLSLLALVSRHNNSFEHLESAFSLAMDLLSPDKAWVIQAESAIHTIMKDLDNTLVHRAFNGVVGAAVGNFNTSIPNPYDHGTSEETKVLPLWDFSQLNRVVESVWRRTAEGSQELHVYIVDSFLRLYPDNPDLYLWMGEAEEAAGHMNECRKVLVACLKRFPSSDHVWKRMMSIFQGPLGSMDVITKASLLSPLAARLSRMVTFAEH
ncbi:hypothetical protein EDD21DRAFT_240334 [Dissophora ornata]|nr:hypothetical protein EDD21DRAFT_240334 [Dissophora ornata]